MHQGILAAAREDGMIDGFEVTGDRLFTIEVDAARWRTEPIESRELLAIAGWCQVAGEDGHGVALVIDGASGNEVGTVVDGEFAEPGD